MCFCVEAAQRIRLRRQHQDALNVSTTKPLFYFFRFLLCESIQSFAFVYFSLFLKPTIHTIHRYRNIQLYMNIHAIHLYYTTTHTIHLNDISKHTYYTTIRKHNNTYILKHCDHAFDDSTKRPRFRFDYILHIIH